MLSTPSYVTYRGKVSGHPNHLVKKRLHNLYALQYSICTVHKVYSTNVVPTRQSRRVPRRVLQSFRSNGRAPCLVRLSLEFFFFIIP
jgi:glutamine synthetase